MRREVVLVVTPGLAGDPQAIDAGAELALVALVPGPQVGLAVLDASTGDLRATTVARAERGLPTVLLEELRRVAPRELVIPVDAEFEAEIARELPDVVRSRVGSEYFDAASAPRHPEGLRADAEDPASRAAAALLHYVGRHQPFALGQIARLRRYALTDAMVLDAATRAHLELFRNADDGSRARTLLDRIDATRTPLGARRLARWLAYPLVEPDAILARQAAVAFLADRDRLRSRLRDALGPVRNLDRLLAKAARPGACPRDLVALRASLEALPALEAAFAQGKEEWLGESPAALPAPRSVPRVAELLREALEDEVRALPRGSRGALETGYVRAGFHAELDGLREGVHKGREWIAGLEGEGARAHRHRGAEDPLPPDPRLRDRGEQGEPRPGARRLTSGSRASSMRSASRRRGCARSSSRCAAAPSARPRSSARSSSGCACRRSRPPRRSLGRPRRWPSSDALASLAEVARRDGWTRPLVDASRQLSIRAGRHPVIEPLLALHGGEAFVPNDAELDPEARQILVLTGPNMSGKST